MNETLKAGSIGPTVKELQRLLNEKVRLSPRLYEDGIFGSKTRYAVERYQNDQWLVKDGIVGRCTWNALKGLEQYVISTPTDLVPQWTNTTCWSAATAMLLGMRACMSSGPATATPESGLLNDSDTMSLENTRKFAQYHGLTMLAPQSWTANGLARLLGTHKRLMVDALWDVRSYIAGWGSSGHMMIIAGIRGDGTESGTTVRIYDPWPVGKGSVYSANYGRLMQRVPGFTYQIFHR
jgi:hypothetical protein